jgi:hypothetical protein
MRRNPTLAISGAILVFFLQLLCPPGLSDVIYVDDDASPGGDGSSWGTAYKYLQDGLYKPPTGGDQIWVAAGTYKPDETTANPGGSGSRTATFQLINGVGIYGGFAGVETTLEERDWENNETILSGDLAGDDNPATQVADLLNDPSRAENSYQVICGSSVPDDNAILDGFIVTGGNANGNFPFNSGGGIYYFDGTITNCTITGNSAMGGGGGFEICRGPITNCRITGNLAEDGGGLCSCDGPITNCRITGNWAMGYCGGALVDCDGPITFCTINDNWANGAGGGLCECDGSITSCTISGNATGGWGGGLIWCDGSITDCTVSSNSAMGDGGGFEICRGPITNCRITGNSAQNGGGLSRCESPVTFHTISNCTITGNSAVNGGGLYECDGTITVCTIIGNSAEERSGGLYRCNGIITNCIIWENRQPYSSSSVSWSSVPLYSCIQDGSYGTGCISSDPLFVDLGQWDTNGTPSDPNDDFWVNGDYHLKSEGWRWDSVRERWDYDDVTSRCIDAGNPGSLLYDEPLIIPDDPNNEWGENIRINMGAYGGTDEASMPPYEWALLADLTNDGIVNLADFAGQAKDWLETANEQFGDLNRDGTVNLPDVVLMVADWLEQTSWY